MSEDVSIVFDEIEERGEAYLVTIDGKEYYLPQSQCRVYPKRNKLYAPEWLLNKEGLI